MGNLNILNCEAYAQRLVDDNVGMYIAIVSVSFIVVGIIVG